MRPHQARSSSFVLLPLLLISCLIPAAQARVPNAAPLGLEIGVTTRAQVKAKLGSATNLAAAGVNKFSGGPMLKGDGKGLGVDGLSEIVFIFDDKELLQAVIMTLPKNFRPTYEMLRKKYTLVSKQIPFVGNSSARFSQGTSVILLDAPHLSFEMTLSYLAESFLARFKSQDAQEQERHEKDQQDRL